MSSNLELSSACAIACPTGTALALQGWGEQYKPPHEWLYGEGELEGFSTDAVRTVTTHFRVANPGSVGYGFAHNVVNTDLTQLSIMQGRMAESPARDNHILPEHVQFLRRSIESREQARERFDGLTVERRRAMTSTALPFLQELAASLIDLDPDFADLNEMVAALADQESSDSTVAREFATSMRDIRHAHMLDQGAFMVAKQAADTCQGPWSSNAKVGLANKLLRRKIGQVCPIAAERDLKYYHAQIEARHQQG